MLLYVLTALKRSPGAEPHPLYELVLSDPALAALAREVLRSRAEETIRIKEHHELCVGVVRFRAVALLAVAQSAAEAERFLALLKGIISQTLDAPVKSLTLLKSQCKSCVDEAFARWSSVDAARTAQQAEDPGVAGAAVAAAAAEASNPRPLSPSKVNWDPTSVYDAPRWTADPAQNFAPPQQARPAPIQADPLGMNLLLSTPDAKPQWRGEAGTPGNEHFLIEPPSNSSQADGPVQLASWEAGQFAFFDGQPREVVGGAYQQQHQQHQQQQHQHQQQQHQQQQQQHQQQQQQHQQYQQHHRQPLPHHQPQYYGAAPVSPMQPPSSPVLLPEQHTPNSGTREVPRKPSIEAKMELLVDDKSIFDSRGSSNGSTELLVPHERSSRRGHRRNRTWSSSQSRASKNSLEKKGGTTPVTPVTPVDLAGFNARPVSPLPDGQYRGTHLTRSISSRYSPPRRSSDTQHANGLNAANMGAVRAALSDVAMPGHGGGSMSMLFTPSSPPIMSRGPPPGYSNLQSNVITDADMAGSDNSIFSLRRHRGNGGAEDTPGKQRVAVPRPSGVSVVSINEALQAEFGANATVGDSGKLVRTHLEGVKSQGISRVTVSKHSPDVKNLDPSDPATYGISHQVPEKKVLTWAKPKSRHKGSSAASQPPAAHRRDHSGSSGSIPVDGLGEATIEGHANRGLIPPYQPRDSSGSENPKQAPDVRILLPLDYSGMDDIQSGDENTPPEVRLFQGWDVQTLNALKTQVQLCQQRADLLTVLHLFRDFLKSVPLPRPASVQREQALKDAGRERVVVNGIEVQGDGERLRKIVCAQLLSLVADGSDILEHVVTDVVRAASRTAHGGDAYVILQSLFVRQSADGMPTDLLTPSPNAPPPIAVKVESDGFIYIRSTDRFLLRDAQAIMMGEFEDEDDDRGDSDAAVGAESGEVGISSDGISTEQSTGSTGGNEKFLDRIKKVVKGRRGSVVNKYVYVFDNPERCIHLETQVEVRMGLLDGSWNRSIRISSPQVEGIPAQCIFLGAGHAAANGSYDLQGFQEGRPWYLNRHGYMLRYSETEKSSSSQLPGSRWEVIGAKQQKPLYGATPDSLPPPHPWYVLMDGVIANALAPPPTLMHNFSDAHLVSRACDTPTGSIHASNSSNPNPTAGYRLTPQPLNSEDAERRAQFYQNLMDSKGGQSSDPFSDAPFIRPAGGHGGMEGGFVQEEDEERGTDEDGAYGAAVAGLGGEGLTQDDGKLSPEDERRTKELSSVPRPDRPPPDRAVEGSPGSSSSGRRSSAEGNGRPKEKAMTNPKLKSRLRLSGNFWRKNPGGTV